MHALFHIRSVIIPRDRYRPEGFSPRVDIGGGMITVLIWKKACINLCIMHIFKLWIKKNKIYFPHRFFIFSTRVSLCFQNTNKSFLAGRRHFPNDNWKLGGSDVMGLTRGLIACYQSFAPISAHGLISLWHFRCLRMVKIGVITYKYVIHIYNDSN
jgi:hypothetical protein